MPIPANVSSDISALDAAIVGASPLENAQFGILAALATQANQLVNDIDAAIPIVAGQLDTFIAPIMPPAMVIAFFGIQDSGQTQWQLSTIAGYAGRMATNLTNG